jgi:hypothetical protein
MGGAASSLSGMVRPIDRHVAPLDKALVVEPLAERGQEICERRRGSMPLTDGLQARCNGLGR